MLNEKSPIPLTRDLDLYEVTGSILVGDRMDKVSIKIQISKHSSYQILHFVVYKYYILYF